MNACTKPPPPKSEPESKPKSEPAPVADDTPDEPEAMETGLDCATAEVECISGACMATIDNKCDKAITCAFEVISLCRRGSTTGEERGKARGTAVQAEKTQIKAVADCQEAEVVATTGDKLSCS